MTREEAQEYAKTMSYKEAVLNCIHSKGIAYRKASLIKLRELAEIADKLERDNDMTREEAIKRLSIHKSTEVWIDSIAEAIDMAIEALSAKPNCKACKKHNNTTFFMDDEEASDTTIETLSADRPTGEWIPHATSIGGKKYIEYSRCSECGEMALVRMNYCPICGAKMMTKESE